MKLVVSSIVLAVAFLGGMASATADDRTQKYRSGGCEVERKYGDTGKYESKGRMQAWPRRRAPLLRRREQGGIQAQRLRGQARVEAERRVQGRGQVRLSATLVTLPSTINPVRQVATPSLILSILRPPSASKSYISSSIRSRARPPGQ